MINQNLFINSKYISVIRSNIVEPVRLQASRSHGNIFNNHRDHSLYNSARAGGASRPARNVAFIILLVWAGPGPDITLEIHNGTEWP